MALGDFLVANSRGENPKSTPYQTKAGQTAIKAGEFVVKDTSDDVEYAVGAANGASSTSIWIGVAASNDTVTASADGVVEVYDDPQYIFRGKPTTPANLASTLINTQVTLDVTNGKQTVDENDTSNGTLIIRDFDINKGTIDVQMAQADHLSQG